MAEEKKQKYLTKTVKFGSKTLSMFSLDGITWSTKKDELEQIKERQELQRLNLVNNKTGAPAQGGQKFKRTGPSGASEEEESAPVEEEEESEEGVEEETLPEEEGYEGPDVVSEEKEGEPAEGEPQYDDYDKKSEEELVFSEIDANLAQEKEKEVQEPRKKKEKTATAPVRVEKIKKAVKKLPLVKKEKPAAKKSGSKIKVKPKKLPARGKKPAKKSK